MNRSNLFFSFQPEDLMFQIELGKQTCCDLKVSNKTDCHVAFKVLTTAPKKYCVKPNRGVLQPLDSWLIRVILQAQREYPPDMISKDKFLIKGTIVSSNSDTVSLSADTFAKDSGRVIEEIKLRVLHLSPIYSDQGDDDLPKSFKQINNEKSVSRHLKEKVRAAVREMQHFCLLFSSTRTGYVKMHGVGNEEATQDSP